MQFPLIKSSEKLGNVNEELQTKISLLDLSEVLRQAIWALIFIITIRTYRNAH